MEKLFILRGEGLHTMQHYLDRMLDIYNLKNVSTQIEPKFIRKVDIPIQIPDDTKVRELLNWKPTIPIEKTLKDLVDYWLEELE